jgi:2-O-methyltransferase
VNADIELQLSDWELDRMRRLCDEGLCYFVRYNRHSRATPVRDHSGIDAFLFHGRNVPALPESFLALGLPFWDYWLPHAFAAAGLPVYAVDFPAALHLSHPLRWSWDTWHRCGVEFARVTGEDPGDGSFHGCHVMSARVRRALADLAVPLASQPPSIVEWIRETFAYPGEKVFVELGAHVGEDTAHLAEIPDVIVHALEPDPRNDQPPRDNVVLHRAAIADRDGQGRLLLSDEWLGQEWTYSSSIRQPKHHLTRFPVTFGDTVDVQLITLDTFVRQQALERIDFVWADIQGAEGDMARGGRESLRRTRYLYTEYSDDELYEGQPTLTELLALLEGFSVLELWPDDVLLENRAVAA